MRISDWSSDVCSSDLGKDVRVGVFARGAKAEEALAAGAEVVGAEDLLEAVQGGKIDFDRGIATPDMMGLVGRLGEEIGRGSGRACEWQIVLISGVVVYLNKILSV